MGFFRITGYSAIIFVLQLFLFASICFSQSNDWPPLDTAELAAGQSVVEPNADAEALVWEVRVDDRANTLTNYVKVKIYTERGRNLFAKYAIAYETGRSIEDLAARVTKSDGSVAYLKKEDVFEQDIIRRDGFKVRSKSFALAGVEVGSIVEYKYKEVLGGGFNGLWLIFQRELPIRRMTYYVRPNLGDRSLYFERFNVGNTAFEEDKKGFYRATMNNLPSFIYEPYMPADVQVRSSIYIFYESGGRRKPERYWNEESKKFYNAAKSYFRSDGKVEETARKLVSDAVTEEEKIRRIFDFVKTEIKNLHFAEKWTHEEFRKIENSSPGSTLELRMGTVGDVNTLFAALARAAGFEVRSTLSGSKQGINFDPRILNVGIMLGFSSIAVKVDGNWRYFSPGIYFTTYGMLSWQEEGQTALITDPDEIKWAKIPISPPESTLTKRRGRFQLTDDGTLDGELSVEYTGHESAFMKGELLPKSAAERVEFITKIFRGMFGTPATIDGVTFENVSDTAKPLIIGMKLRVVGYASRSGSRLFVLPNVTAGGSRQRFVSRERKHDIVFKYAFSEDDNFIITLPAGFSIESPDVPSSVADPTGISSHKTSIGATKDGRTLVYRRSFSFGSGGRLRFPATSYSALKSLFDSFEKADRHTIVLKHNASP